MNRAGRSRELTASERVDKVSRSAAASYLFLLVCTLVASIEHWTEPSPDAGEGIEQVRRRVAPVVQHLVKREDVVVDAVVGEVGVFDAAESD